MPPKLFIPFPKQETPPSIRATFAKILSSICLSNVTDIPIHTHPLLTLWELGLLANLLERKPKYMGQKCLSRYWQLTPKKDHILSHTFYLFLQCMLIAIWGCFPINTAATINHILISQTAFVFLLNWHQWITKHVTVRPLCWELGTEMVLRISLHSCSCDFTCLITMDTHSLQTPPFFRDHRLAISKCCSVNQEQRDRRSYFENLWWPQQQKRSVLFKNPTFCIIPTLARPIFPQRFSNFSNIHTALQLPFLWNYTISINSVLLFVRCETLVAL